MTLRNDWLGKAVRAVQNPVQIDIRFRSGSIQIRTNKRRHGTKLCRALDALVAVTRAHGYALAARRAAAAEHGCARLGLHARAKAMRLHAAAAVGLKCALGHGMRSCFLLKNLRLDGKL
jgi:hypothetical protein